MFDKYREFVGQTIKKFKEDNIPESELGGAAFVVTVVYSVMVYLIAMFMLVFGTDFEPNINFFIPTFILFVLAAAALLEGAATVIMNYIGWQIQRDDHETVDSLFFSMPEELWNRVMEKCGLLNILIVALLLASFHSTMLLVAGMLITIHFSLAIVGRLYRLTKKLNEHIADKDAHS